MQFNLNERQQEAVQHKAGPLLIIAGAGTGKTAVITRRITHIINEGWAKPSEILALTFTEKAAGEMLERVDQEMPIGHEEIAISTFHSFCDRILRQEGIYIGLDTNYKLMSQAQSYILFKKNLFTMSLDKFRPLGNPTSHIDDILKHFSRLQDEDVFPEEYIKFAEKLPSTTEEEEELKAEAVELAKVYKEYSDIKVRESMLDFGDLILLTLRLFREKPNVLKKYHDLYKYILVDEYQDTNYTQNVLVNTIAFGGDQKNKTVKQKQPNVTVVGDDDQAIYKFRGAAISNILQFNKTYKGVKKVVLVENYRSRQEILNAAYDLIQKNNPDRLEISESIDKRLAARAEFEVPEVDPVQLIVADSGAVEADSVAKEILNLTGNKELLKNDNSIVSRKFDSKGQSMFVDVEKENGAEFRFSDIALLVRANNNSDEFIQAFKYYGIPFKFSGPKGLYSRPEISKLISFLRLVVDYKDDRNMFNILKMQSLDLDSRDVVELMRLAKEQRLSIFEEIEAITGTRIGDVESEEIEIAENRRNLIEKTFSTDAIDSMKALVTLFDSAFKAVKEGRSIGEILYDFVKSSGYLDSMTEVESYENQFKIQNMTKFFDLIKSYERDNNDASIYDYVDYLNYSIEIGESPRVDEDMLEDFDAVKIMTVHGSKGLEFPVVFLTNLVSDRFPTRRRSDTIPIAEELVKEQFSDEDERIAHLKEERRLFYVGATRAKERLYLTAAKVYGDAKTKRKPSLFLDELLGRKVSLDFAEDGANVRKEPEFKVQISTYDDSLDVKGLNISAPLNLSYSQIKTYDDCGKKYKYQYIIRLPSKPSSTLSFGNTVHAVLKSFYEQQRAALSGLEGFVQTPTVDDLIDSYHDKWISTGYDSREHEKIRKEYGERKLREFYENFYSVKENPIELEKSFHYKIGGVGMTGKIDRIDLVGKEDGREVVDLLDYKTGKKKELRDVKNDLQLALYTIVCEEVFNMKVRKAGLLFVEHCERVDIEVDEKMRQKCKEKIHEVVELIRKEDFAAKPSKFTCGFCDFRDICSDAVI
ncbi:MAG: UvrD-helicase domain-containing protein [Candidatus Dojkabacteria bacterium]|nr:MAG: UvrD-helicase domain-containing protein [Candidatus Dojkabacteria bacterium]